MLVNALLINCTEDEVVPYSHKACTCITGDWGPGPEDAAVLFLTALCYFSPTLSGGLASVYSLYCTVFSLHCTAYS